MWPVSHKLWSSLNLSFVQWWLSNEESWRIDETVIACRVSPISAYVACNFFSGISGDLMVSLMGLLGKRSLSLWGRSDPDRFTHVAYSFHSLMMDLTELQIQWFWDFLVFISWVFLFSKFLSNLCSFVSMLQWLPGILINQWMDTGIFILKDFCFDSPPGLFICF